MLQVERSTSDEFLNERRHNKIEDVKSWKREERHTRSVAEKHGPSRSRATHFQKYKIVRHHASLYEIIDSSQLRELHLSIHSLNEPVGRGAYLFIHKIISSRMGFDLRRATQAEDKRANCESAESQVQEIETKGDIVSARAQVSLGINNKLKILS